MKLLTPTLIESLLHTIRHSKLRRMQCFFCSCERTVTLEQFTLEELEAEVEARKEAAAAAAATKNLTSV